MKVEDVVVKLRKDIERVMNLRNSGKPLTKEEQLFAEKVADEMIGLRFSKSLGVQLISKERIDFIKGQQPVQGSDAVGGIVQDVVANVQTQKGKFPRKTDASTDESDGVAKADIKGCKCKQMPISGAESGAETRKSPDAENIKLNPPENQAEGAVTSTADVVVDTTQPEATEVKTEVPSEKIGHQPNEPMPKKQAEDLVNNAKWGVEIGAYTNVEEGIDKQLARKDYAEFIDTDEKLKDVTAYLKSLVVETEPIAVNS